MIHTGTISYLNKIHKQYGVHKYWIKTLKVWCDGKHTVEFVKKIMLAGPSGEGFG